MGRSVMTYSDNCIYLTFEPSDVDDCQWEWDSFKESIQEQLTEMYKSFEAVHEYVGNEGVKICENSLCSVVISEYCGLVSLSFVNRPWNESDYYCEQNLINLAEGWINRIFPKVEKTFSEYKKVGTFSNGCGVFERV